MNYELKDFNRIMERVNEVRIVAGDHEEGFTYDMATMSYRDSGYAVAYHDTQDSFGVLGLVKAVAHAYNNGNEVVGGWYNKENEQFYFDSIRIFPSTDLQGAIEFGRHQKQIAIFNLDTMEEIRL